MNIRRISINAQGRERYLLIIAGLFLLMNALGLSISGPQVGMPLFLLVVWSIAAFCGHRILNRILPKRDPFLFAIAMLLSGWGLLLIQRLAPNFAIRQALWMLVGLTIMLLISTLPTRLHWLRRYRYTWLLGGLALLLVTILMGVNPSGAGPRLWLGVGPLYFQPSELVKLVLVIFLASYLADYQSEIRNDGGQPRRLPPLHAIGPLVLMWGLCMIVTLWQQDLGTAALLFIVFLTMLYIASGEWTYIVVGGGLLMAAVAVAYRLFSVVQLRVDIWLNPWPEANDRAFQIVQSLMAFASGGLLGAGIGQGSPGYVPVVHSDFIFAAVGEEWGLIGVLCLIVCLAVLIIRGLHIAALWSDIPFRMLLAAGLSILLAVQTLLIMGGVIKLIPMTGVTLPLMSYGGSSLLISFTIIGLFLILSAPPNRVDRSQQ
jgi:cell division protein FtsW (lipid II flippase)